jgi:hypothetical protein
MARKMKGGDDGFIESMFAAGIGAYAAKNATSMSGLLWTLAKYALIILGVLLLVMIVMGLLRVATSEHFVPVSPSPEQDQKMVTPAGNVITY